MKFTIEEFRTYLLTQDSMGDILYNLSEEKVKKAIENAKNADLLEGEFENSDDTDDDSRFGK